MLDYNAKFDRRDSSEVLDVDAIRDLVGSRLNGSEIESISLLTGGFMNSNYRLLLRAGSVWQVAGILDWEFAIGGSPLVDIGNFLRFEDELPSGLREAFIQGYLSDSNELPGNWREIAKLLDLAAMVNFLEGEGDTPKTFGTAISVIENTIGTSEARSKELESRI